MTQLTLGIGISNHVLTTQIAIAKVPINHGIENIDELSRDNLHYQAVVTAEPVAGCMCVLSGSRSIAGGRRWGRIDARPARQHHAVHVGARGPLNGEAFVAITQRRREDIR
ncbi:hypothetical protein QO004_005550 [Rhizobium mesoamericanum]|nr:hypothetical protein [Rhizobium mesoamericanum]